LNSRPRAYGPTVKGAAEPARIDLSDLPEDIREVADMPLREIVGRFGTDSQFLEWLKATKLIEDIHASRLKNAETEGKLVSRELVETGIIDPVQTAHTLLLSDGARTAAARSYSMAKAGDSVEDIRIMLEDLFSGHIKAAKQKMSRAMRLKRGGYAS